jgi:hypothetical protein
VKKVSDVSKRKMYKTNEVCEMFDISRADPVSLGARGLDYGTAPRLAELAPLYGGEHRTNQACDEWAGRTEVA